MKKKIESFYRHRSNSQATIEIARDKKSNHFRKALTESCGGAYLCPNRAYSEAKFSEAYLEHLLKSSMLPSLVARSPASAILSKYRWRDSLAPQYSFTRMWLRYCT